MFNLDLNKLNNHLQFISRDSSVGRALDWRSKGPRFDPGSRQFIFFMSVLAYRSSCTKWFGATKWIVITDMSDSSQELCKASPFYSLKHYFMCRKRAILLCVDWKAIWRVGLSIVDNFSMGNGFRRGFCDAICRLKITRRRLNEFYERERYLPPI